ncbi:hypothetical protein MNBD_GAMMA22-1692 [hydrothermal vent metagenome]|uniref:Uncharacterized protein n=1 Tax=hydrothermal vent metagenome TaxID=652676 RepID=A0A3B0ZT95_9ZZZZ
MTKRKHKDNRQRLLIAQQAAKILAKSGNRDFLAAKNKAVERLGILDKTQLPTNIEIERALIEYQRIFCGDEQPQIVFSLRQAALKAMKLFADFSPKLVGSVLAGTSDQHSPVHLHLFADTSEDITVFLIEQRIPFEIGEQKVRYGHDVHEFQPTFNFYAGDVRFLLTVFVSHGKKQSPLSPIDGKTMPRANTMEVEKLLVSLT